MQNKNRAPRPQAVLAQTEPSSDKRRSSAHRVGLAALLCAIVGCASSTPSPRDATDEVAFLEPAAASPAHSAPLHGDEPSSRAGQPAARRRAASARGDADLPWLNPSHVGAAVRAHHDDFQACQALGDLESRREDGAVTVGWLVLPDGSVNDVTVGPSTFQSVRINSCVLDVAKQVTFPRSGSPASISWTLEFRGASSHAPLATVH
jgi:hypothetical protein